MKPEYIGIGNFDTDNYVYSYCNCPLSGDYAIKWPLIKDGKPHSYTCTCEDCGTTVSVIAKSYDPEVYKGDLENTINRQEPCKMTNEEAINVLSDIDHAWRNFSQKEYVALEMAIKTLKQESCENAIENAIKYFNTIYELSQSLGVSYNFVEEKIEEIITALKEKNRCNQCKYYEGVHNVQGHAPCSFLKCGGVLWDWYCSNYEPYIV